MTGWSTKSARSGARIHLIPDGDVAPAIAAAVEGSGVDMLLGIGGAPEGVLAAAALKCMGGDMQGRLVFMSQEERERARTMGIEDFDKVYTTEEMARGDVFFAATGVTNGDLLRGCAILVAAPRPIRSSCARKAARSVSSRPAIVSTASRIIERRGMALPLGLPERY
jgi:fructose-1,6-bisphosphatase/sedoheptulose 1,7-bisphosphatase-like protein